MGAKRKRTRDALPEVGSDGATPSGGGAKCGGVPTTTTSVPTTAPEDVGPPTPPLCAERWAVAALFALLQRDCSATRSLHYQLHSREGHCCTSTASDDPRGTWWPTGHKTCEGMWCCVLPPGILTLSVSVPEAFCKRLCFPANSTAAGGGGGGQTNGRQSSNHPWRVQLTIDHGYTFVSQVVLNTALTLCSCCARPSGGKGSCGARRRNVSTTKSSCGIAVWSAAQLGALPAVVAYIFSRRNSPASETDHRLWALALWGLCDGGHVDCLRWILSRLPTEILRCDCETSRAFHLGPVLWYVAAQLNEVAILRMLREYGYPFFFPPQGATGYYSVGYYLALPPPDFVMAPLVAAIVKRKEKSQKLLQTVQFLIAETTTVSSEEAGKKREKLQGRERDGTHALAWAAAHDMPEVVDCLLSAGVSVEGADWGGCTPFWRAAVHGKLSMAGRFHALGANVDARDSTGRTAFFVAACYADIPTMRFLVGLGADIEAVDLAGATAFWRIASSLENSEGWRALRHLITTGANVNPKVRGITALERAADVGTLAVVVVLLQCPAVVITPKARPLLKRRLEDARRIQWAVAIEAFLARGIGKS